MSKQRLDKILSACLPLSRSELKKAAAGGRITLNGVTVADLSQKADGDTDIICFDCRRLNTSSRLYIMLNKPKGVISASEGRGEKTVIDLLPDEFKRSGLFPAGRLDKDTTGFLLITDDGDFAHRILSPKNHVEKTYIATLDTPIDGKGVKELENGISLNDGTLFLPAVITPLDSSMKVVKTVICEGKYHQVKRMFKAVGCEVLELRRIAMGKLMLDENLAQGEAKLLGADEIKLIES